MGIKIKRIIKYFVPEGVVSLRELLRGLHGKILMKGQQDVHGNMKGKSLYILGNGPSLTETLEKHFALLSNQVCAVVNSFATTDYYTQLQPKWYVLADPAFFKDFEKLSTNVREVVISLSDAINEKTTWTMNLVLPIIAEDTPFVKQVSRNKNIIIYYYNNYGNSSLIKNGVFKYKLWDSNLLAPLAQTVLNTVIHIGIVLRFKEIYLLGADTSWHENYEMDQCTNMLYCKDLHFYGNKRIPVYLDAEGKLPSKLHLELLMVSKALEGYWILRNYSRYAAVEIYNASEFSWIDAFERKKIKD